MLVCLTLAGAAGVWIYRDFEQVLTQPIDLAAPALFEIRRGEGLAGVTTALAAKGWVKRPLYLRWEATRRGFSRRLQAGTYEVEAGVSPRRLLSRFARGEVKRYRFTVVEGSTFRALRAQIMRLPGVVQTVSGLSDAELMARLGMAGVAAEGRFFPSTYEYLHQTEDFSLLQRAHREMQRVLTEAWSRRQPDLPYASPSEALTMASIIEKETGLAAERARIAGVFVRRLRLGMRLQTDPSVIYGLAETFRGNLRRKDLVCDTPYNTYTRSGLPPTPIALPGRAAILAALAPADDDSLYFVARGDGSHQFSATLAAHQRAVRDFQLP